MPASLKKPAKYNTFFLLAIFSVAVVLRVAYLKEYVNSGIYPYIEASDSEAYFSWARDIAGGDITGSKAFMKWPLYAYFLAVVFKLTMQNPGIAFVLQFMFGSLNCLLIYLIAKKIFDSRTALVAGLLSAFYGLFIFYDFLLIYTSLSLLLNSLFLLYFLRIKDKPGEPGGVSLFILGLFLGFCTLAQASVLIFGLLCVAWLFAARRTALRKTFVNLSVFLLGLMIVLGAVTVRNFIVEKDLVLLTGNTGINLYMGNNPKAKGTFTYLDNIGLNQEDMFRDARIIASAENARQLKTSEVSNYWQKKAVDYILNDPAHFIKLLSKKIFLVFSPAEFIHDVEYDFIKGRMSIFNKLMMNLFPVFPFVALGILLGLRQINKTAPLYLALMGFAGGIVVFFVSARYRIVMVPFFMIFAGFGIVSLWDALRDKKFSRFLVYLALAVVISSPFYVSGRQKELKGPSQAGDLLYDQHLIRAAALKNELRLKQALQELDAARSIYPDRKQAIFQSGVINFSLNNLSAAEECFRRVIEISPLSVDAYYNLGYIYDSQFRFQEAIPLLNKAVELDPDNWKSHYELGFAYRSLGDKEKAREHFGTALKLINKWRSIDIQLIKEELASLKE